MPYTILVVDDESAIRSALRRTLQRDGYQIIEAASGEEAVDLLLGAQVDLILSDHLMPGMNGLDFLKQACVLQPQALRVMLTGVADPDVILTAVNEGQVYRYLLKPWDDFDLRVMVRLAFRHLEIMREADPDGKLARKAITTTGVRRLTTREIRAHGDVADVPAPVERPTETPN